MLIYPSVMAKPALGKGFGALINQNLTNETLATPQAGDVVHQLKHDTIIPSDLQPRAIFTPDQLAELVESIREHGIIQPLIVRKASEANKFELIAGERRWRAAGVLKLEKVPVIIREASDKDVLEMALIENLQRENLSPLEEAAGYMRLKSEFKMKQSDIAKRVGKSRAAVANTIRLLDLAESVQELLMASQISVGHAKVLLSLKNTDQQVQLGRDIVSKGYTVRKTEKIVQKLLAPPEEPHIAKRTSSPQYKKIASTMSDQFGTQVNISGQGGKGSIEICFTSKAELIRILELLGQEPLLKD